MSTGPPTVGSRLTASLVLGLVLLLLAVAGTLWLLRDPDSRATPAPGATGAMEFPAPAVAQDAPELATAVSAPREDSYYPEVGDPGVDALHYALDLTWQPGSRTLEGVETLVFRATRDDAAIRLDLGEPLVVAAVEIDGRPVPFDHRGKDLEVRVPVTADERYTLQLAYSGTPEPVPAPTNRTDFSTTGWTITDRDEVWTMQEPFGAYTWYAVNDQPADKALYDFRLTVAAPWSGVANGTMTSREVVDGSTVTTFDLAEPASSYLITVAFGDYLVRTDETASGIPVSFWWLRSQRGAYQDLSYGTQALEWIEQKLGPYPFSSAGILLTDSDSGMETQTLVTLGDDPYIRSREVIVHEMVHQWYGDTVTPTDWRDVWMNEGMTTYLQLVYRAETEQRSIDAVMREVETYDQGLRDEAGPPGDFDPGSFGASNVYYCPALMWHELRQRVGDREFWRLAGAWPRRHAYGNASRGEWFAWIETRTGLELSAFFGAWLMGSTTPPVD